MGHIVIGSNTCTCREIAVGDYSKAELKCDERCIHNLERTTKETGPYHITIKPLSCPIAATSGGINNNQFETA